jgi:type II secretory pathway pseudopilin PulG
MKAARRRTDGFTLLELLLAGAIGVVLLGGAYMVYEAGHSTTRKDERKVDLQQNARAALDLLMWQIRLAGYLNGAITPNRVAIGTDTLLVVRGDVQVNGALNILDTLFAVQPAATAICPTPPCLVTGTNVYTMNAAQMVTAFNIASLTFAYFDQNNNPLPAPLDNVVAGAYPDGSPAPSPLGGPTTNRDAVRKVRLTLTALDPRVSAGPGVGSTPEQITLTADVRIRNAD